jgi:hypothetical protein
MIMIEQRPFGVPRLRNLMMKILKGDQNAKNNADVVDASNLWLWRELVYG